MSAAKSPLAAPQPLHPTHSLAAHNLLNSEHHLKDYNTNLTPGSQLPYSPNSNASGVTPTPSYPNPTGYFPNATPHQQPQFPPQQHQQLPPKGAPHVNGFGFVHDHQQLDHEDQTQLNTTANSQIASPYPEGLIAPYSVRSARFTEEWDASQRGSSIIDGHHRHQSQTPAGRNTMSSIHRSNSFSGSASGDREAAQLPSRSNTLKKKSSVRRSASLKRSGSRRSMAAGSVKSLALQSNDGDEMHSAFYCPVPTTGNPTEALANRFQSWRKILKDLITYFREIQTHYEHRSKSLVKLANVLNNVSTPAGFLTSGGIDDALQILRNYNKLAIAEAQKAREIEEDVILALTGLRSDLQQKIKEIKNLAGDFKNTVDKEMDVTRKAVKQLNDVLGQAELDPAQTTGKQDPYLLRLAVDRQLERQIEEENYLHQAYLNLEKSGRELESIVAGEIQKAYNAYAGILKRESDAAYNAIEELRVGPIAMPKDHEWINFVRRDNQFVDPEIPIRSAQFIHYPGRDHYASQEIRAGLLERKSKYLKSYTPGWYVLSPTHLHEFKSADKTQAPVMSLYLPEQKLGSHSTGSGSSNKFILKGRQTGSMHRGHTWVFRAESHDTMMAWYEDIKSLTEKTPQERSEFVRGHSRSFSRSSQHSMSSDGVVDEDDEEPFDADAQAVTQVPRQDSLPRRPSPGGRFPSDLQVNAQRGLQAPLSPSSVSSELAPENSDNRDRDVIAAAGALPNNHAAYHEPQQPNPTQPPQQRQQQQYEAPPEPQSATIQDPRYGYGSTAYAPMNEAQSRAAMVTQDAREDGVNPYTNAPVAQRSAADSVDPNVMVGTGSFAHDHMRPLRAEPNERLAAGQSGPRMDSWTDQKQVVEPASQPQMAPIVTTGVVNSTAPHEQSSSAGLAAPSGPGLDSPSTTTSFSLADSQAPSFGATAVNGGKQVNGRPTSTNVRTDSVPTISNLHIPGEYPKGTPASAN